MLNNEWCCFQVVEKLPGENLSITRFLEYPPFQQIYLEVKERFRKKVNYSLTMKFNSKLSLELEGFYLSSYINKDGEKRYVIELYVNFNETQFSTLIMVQPIKYPYSVWSQHVSLSCGK